MVLIGQCTTLRCTYRCCHCSIHQQVIVDLTPKTEFVTFHLHFIKGKVRPPFIAREHLGFLPARVVHCNEIINVKKEEIVAESNSL